MLRILSYALIGLKDPRSVLNKIWQWETPVTPVEKITVRMRERYTIALMPDGKVQARFDCNRGSGSYEISAGRLSFGPLLSTRMACPADSLEGLFMRDLQRVVGFSFRMAISTWTFRMTAALRVFDRRPSTASSR
jgi:heat shock protein HslJ